MKYHIYFTSVNTICVFYDTFYLFYIYMLRKRHIYDIISVTEVNWFGKYGNTHKKFTFRKQYDS